MNDLKVEYRNIKELIPYCNNSRTHSDEQVLQIASSIKAFGFTNPILIDEKLTVIAGHGRLLAAKKINMDSVPCVMLEGLTEKQKKAYVITDNKIAMNSGWDEEMLRSELAFIANDGFNLEITGFDIDELSKIFDETGGISISEEMQELKDHVFTVKYPQEKRIEVMNALAAAIAEIVGASLWCDDEQI